MRNTAKEIIAYCQEEGKAFWQLVLEEECQVKKTTEEAVRQQLQESLAVMASSAQANLNQSQTTRFAMADGFAQAAHTYAKDGEPVSGSFVMEVMAKAFSTAEVNCAMGKIVAAPTAGSAGILPAVLMGAKERYDLSEEALENALLTAIGIGQLIAKYATFAGAEGGCQAECGSAAAMAAAALIQLQGGTVEQCLHGASIALLNVLGLVCDPVAGLVQYPCAFRNASGAVGAMIACDMAMAGITSIVPFEEVAQAMGDVGRSLAPDLRETGLGGIAGTPTGKRIRKEFLGE